MSTYVRSTRGIDLDHGDRPSAQAIEDFVERKELTGSDALVLMACETTSSVEQRRFLRSRSTVTITTVLLTASWLIWATRVDGGVPAVLGVRIRDVQFEDYEKSTMYARQQDAGITISGIDSAEGPGTVFIGFGVETSAQKFRSLLRSTAAAA